MREAAARGAADGVAAAPVVARRRRRSAAAAHPQAPRSAARAAAASSSCRPVLSGTRGSAPSGREPPAPLHVATFVDTRASRATAICACLDVASLRLLLLDFRAAVLWIALHLPLLSLESFAATLAAADRSAGRAAARADGRAVASSAPTGGAGARRQAGAEAGDRARARAALVLGQRRPAARCRGARAGRARRARLHADGRDPAVARGRRGAAHGAARSRRRACAISAAAERLLQRLHAALAPLGHASHRVSAPTAQGAAMLARVEPPPRCADLGALRQALDAAPVWLLGPGREHWEALQGMGLRTARRPARPAACRPRRGASARRCSTELDARASAAAPDPREPIVPPRVFESRLELFARADTTEQVLHGARCCSRGWSPGCRRSTPSCVASAC